MGSDPRVWKWMVPAIGMVALVPLGMWINMIAKENMWPWLLWCNFSVVGVMLFLGIQAWAAFGAYYRHLENEDFIDKRNALTTTAETRLFDYAHTMHPETVKLLLMHRKSKWRVKEAKLTELVDWVLDADPRIHVGLVEYVLENSTQYSMMAMNNHFSDKAYEFDPEERQVSDYEQYRAFHRLLINRMMVTEALGNQPGQWIEPWNAELVAKQFGIGLTKDEVEETPSAPSQPIQIDPSLSLRASLGEKKAEQPRKVVEEKPLTDEDMENIRQIQEEHTQKYGMTVKEYYLKTNKKS